MSLAAKLLATANAANAASDKAAYDDIVAKLTAAANAGRYWIEEASDRLTPGLAEMLRFECFEVIRCGTLREPQWIIAFRPQEKSSK